MKSSVLLHTSGTCSWMSVLAVAMSTLLAVNLLDIFRVWLMCVGLKSVEFMNTFCGVGGCKKKMFF